MSILLNILRKLVQSKFFRAGFTLETVDNGMTGWLTRDPYTNEWLLWSPKTKQTYRRGESATAFWRPSPESEAECLKLGTVYAELMGIRL